MSHLTGSLISFVAAWFLWLDQNITLAPDAAHYNELIDGKKTCAPFCFRWYWPKAIRLFSGLRLAKDPGWWVILNMVTLTLLGQVSYNLWGWQGAVLMCFSPFARFNISRPILVDLFTFTTTLWVATLTDWPYWWILALCVGTMRETAPVWLYFYTGNPLAFLGMLVVPVGLFFRRPTNDDDSQFLQSWRAVQFYKRGAYGNWKKQLAPWGALLVAVPFLNPYAWLALAFAYAPQLIATDAARIYYWAAPVMISVAVLLPIPPAFWVVLCAIHIFNPCREV